MDKRHKDILKKHWVEITNDVEPNGEILDHLQEELILTDNECEEVKNCTTRKERCQNLLIILQKSGVNAFHAFLTSLSTSYRHIHESVMNETYDYESSDNGNKCTECRKFFPDRITSQFVRSLLDVHCCDLYNNINPVHIIDFLYQQNILTMDDYERIKKCFTSRDKCKCLFQSLNDCKSENVPRVFLQSLERKYGYIVSKIKQTVKSISQHYVNDNNNNCSGNSKRLVLSDSDASITHNKHYEDSFHNIETNIPSNHAISCNKNMDIDTSLENVLCESRVSRNYSELSELNEFSMSVLSTDSNGFGKTNSDMRCKRRKCDHTYRKEPEGKSFQTLPTFECHYPFFIKDPGNMPIYQFPGRRLTVKFEQLIQLIYQGEYLEFENKVLILRARYQNNSDMCCMLAFLQASRCLFKKDIGEVKECLEKARSLISETSNPKYFDLELQSALVRLNLSEKKFGEAKENLTKGMMLIKTDPSGCRGRAAGWLNFFQSRYETTYMTTINPHRPNSESQYKMYLEEASERNRIALEQFQADVGIDSRIGLGYAMLRSAMLLLKCGDNGCTMDILQPSKDEINQAKKYLDAFENYDIPIKKKFLEVHFLLAKCDYFYRINTTTRALENAESAYALALEMNLQPYTQHAYLRLCHLRKKSVSTSLFVNNIITSESSDTE